MPGEYIEFTAPSEPIGTNRMYIGLSYHDGGFAYTTINYCWYIYHDGRQFAVENGTTMYTNSTPYVPGTTKWRIARTGGNIVYYKNGVAVRTVADANPTQPMTIDITMWDTGSGNPSKVHDLVVGKLEFVIATYAIGDYVPYTHSDYRFGYNGMEKDPEMKGTGNSYTTEFRQYDPRLGRWMSLDPVFQPHQSPFCAMDNNPILLNDPSGLKTDDWIKRKGVEGANYEWSDKYTDEKSANAAGFDFIKAGSIVENAHIGDGPTGTVWAGYSAEDLEYQDMSWQDPDYQPSEEEAAAEEVADALEAVGTSISSAPEEETSQNGNYAGLKNVNLNYFGDGFTTRRAERKPFDISLRTAWQKNMYGFCKTAQQFVLGAAFVISGGVVLIEAAPIVYGQLAGHYGTTVQVNAWYRVGNTAADATTQLANGADLKTWNYGSTIGNFCFNNAFLSSAPGTIYTMTSDGIEGKFQERLASNIWGYTLNVGGNYLTGGGQAGKYQIQGIQGTKYLNGISNGTRHGLGSYTVPVLYNIATDPPE